MPIASRYLATVRRATGMPAAERNSATRPSLNGPSASSSFTSFLLFARMAVAHARQRRGIDLDAPVVLGAAHEHIGHHVFGGPGAHDGARVRMTGAHQRERRG